MEKGRRPSGAIVDARVRLRGYPMTSERMKAALAAKT
jgi:hypothetical protein